MDFVKLLNVYHKRINLTLTKLINPIASQSPLLIDAMHYGTILGGKRIRPFLVYATGEMLKINLTTLDIPAAAIECIHAYSLIHDDLPAIDNDIFRRGKPSCHIKYGENIAILAGDALHTLAFSILADQPMNDINSNKRIAMISELGQASGINGMCSGQALDLTLEKEKIDLPQLEKIHHQKTGALIRAAVRLATLASEENHDIISLLDKYATAIGLAFQIQDDILDFISDTKILNKNKINNLKSHKNTYPSLIGIDKARIKVSELYQEAIETLDILKLQSYNTNVLQNIAKFIIERDK